ncbi:hypothetical protein C4K29_3800 [Pseudomonas chlororaphis subsp. piscium]|nr:hypothetical protein C4K29_3800 [Pseudomonas chlororaphis subsp. piscium]
MRNNRFIKHRGNSISEINRIACQTEIKSPAAIGISKMANTIHICNVRLIIIRSPPLTIHLEGRRLAVR